MHPEAHAWVAQHAPRGTVSVLDVGGRNINGTVRDLLPAADPYVSLDIREGLGVDVVADAATWNPDRPYDVVVCCEVFEHAQEWPAILRTIFAALRPGGLAILTMAGPGRMQHSGVDGEHRLLGDEWYANVPPTVLADVLEDVGFTGITVDYQPSPADTRAVASKPNAI